MNRAPATRSPLLFLCAALLLGCASAPPQPAPEPPPLERTKLRSLDEPEAIALIERLLREAKQRPVAGWQVALPKRTDFEVDLRLGDTGFGIEWVSEQDRTRYGALLPAPGPDGQLRLLSGAEGVGPQPLILVLDHESYRAPERDLEQRLRRDLLDFLEYARSQYRL